MGVKGNRESRSMTWMMTPEKNKLPNAKWSEDAIIRKPGTSDSFAKFLRDGDNYEKFVAYVMYFDKSDNIAYLKDVREDVLYTIPKASKAKGYTLATKLNKYHLIFSKSSNSVGSSISIAIYSQHLLQPSHICFSII
jgi:hypothetical protein